MKPVQKLGDNLKPDEPEIQKHILVLELGLERMKQAGCPPADFMVGVLAALKWVTGKGKNPIDMF